MDLVPKVTCQHANEMQYVGRHQIHHIRDPSGPSSRRVATTITTTTTATATSSFLLEQMRDDELHHAISFDPTLPIANRTTARKMRKKLVDYGIQDPGLMTKVTVSTDGGINFRVCNFVNQQHEK